jgi:hypothetical protein
MTHEQLGQFIAIVDRARQGDEAAKGLLLVVLETERKSTIIGKLRVRDVGWQDLGDAHHDVVLRVGQKIEQLRSARAYFSWELRIIGDVCKRWRRNYRALALTLEVPFADVEGTYTSEEVFHEC